MLIDGVAAYINNIFVVGQSHKELREKLSKVLTRITEFGFHLHPEKCQFFLPLVKYLGFIFIIIQARKRKRMYRVKVGNQVWVQHKQQLRP